MKRNPYGSVLPIPYRAIFSAEEFSRIKRGLLPQEMEDKWLICYDEPSLFLYRSWSGDGVYQVDFFQAADGFEVKKALCASEVLATSSTDYQALMLDFLISNFLLGRSVPFPHPANLTQTPAGLLQHVISGTGYPEVPVKIRRPWWKVWH